MVLFMGLGCQTMAQCALLRTPKANAVSSVIVPVISFIRI